MQADRGVSFADVQFASCQDQDSEAHDLMNRFVPLKSGVWDSHLQKFCQYPNKELYITSMKCYIIMIAKKDHTHYHKGEKKGQLIDTFKQTL